MKFRCILAARWTGMLFCLPLVASDLSSGRLARDQPPQVRDTCANIWSLQPTDDGRRRLVVRPAQAPDAWIAPMIAGIDADQWDDLRVEADGELTLVAKGRAVRFDPRRPQQGAQSLSLAAAHAAPLPSPWRTVARMPVSNHDLSAAVMDGQLFVAGGQTAEWGFPARTRAFDELWQLDGASWTWRIAARFSTPRIYCSTVAFLGRIWVIAGDRLDADGTRRATTAVELFDPQTGKLTTGPDLPDALPCPLALVVRDRLYVMGAVNRSLPGRMVSIGRGEKMWRREPDGPLQMWALAGAAIDDTLYVAVPQVGFATFDTATARWGSLPSPSRPRSSQIAAWRGELWVMGGRDIVDQSETRVFNPVTRTWRTGPALPRPLAWGAAAVLHDRIVVTGGAAGTSYSDRTFALESDAGRPPAGKPVRAPFPSTTELPAWDDSRLRGTGEADLPYTTTRVFAGLRLLRPVTIGPVPTRDPAAPERLLVIECDGPVSTFPNRPDVNRPDVFLNLPARFRQATQTYGVAFHPGFPQVPHVYVVYHRLQPKPAENVLACFTVTTRDPPQADPGSEQVLLRWPSDGHNAGDVKFGPDGMLYVSTGDGSTPGDPRNRGQRVDQITGGILRLDVNRTDPGRNYAVPPDNPFVGRSDALPEYWAYGLRNPWRMSFSPAGDLWAGDNGEDSWESVHLIRRGHNYGWSTFEGSHPFKRTLPLAGPTPRATPPVIELSHAEARSIIGGFVHQGPALPGLAGDYVFGDYVTGFMWAFRWDGSAPRNFRRIADTRGRPLGFGSNRVGDILMVRLDGQIHQLIEAPAGATHRKQIPTRLSETGLFASTAALTLAPGALPFEINAPLWSDGATARRVLALPVGGRIGYAEPKNWQLPDGTAVARTLELPDALGPRRVETQVMHRENGRWQFFTYAWNEAQTDADLVEEAGETRPVPGQPTRRWRFSSRGECTVCHTAQTGFTLGLTSAQFDRDADYSALQKPVANQILTLAALGKFDRAPTASAATSPAANPYDVSQPVDARARAYLSVNCAHCHRPDGVGGRATFQLMDYLPLARTGLVNGVPIVPLLGPDSRLVVPGEPLRSELYHRVATASGGRMPLLGAQLPDKEGINLIRDWIASLRETHPASNPP